jgi:hypothetical protein
VALMWGVGPATVARLAKIGVTTIGQLAASSPQSVERLLGHAVGRKLTALAWNRDPRQIQTVLLNAWPASESGHVIDGSRQLRTVTGSHAIGRRETRRRLVSREPARRRQRGTLLAGTLPQWCSSTQVSATNGRRSHPSVCAHSPTATRFQESGPCKQKTQCRTAKLRCRFAEARFSGLVPGRCFTNHLKMFIP